VLIPGTIAAGLLLIGIEGGAFVGTGGAVFLAFPFAFFPSIHIIIIFEI